MDIWLQWLQWRRDHNGRPGGWKLFLGKALLLIRNVPQAACWTDSRYFIQAANQLDCNWELMRMGQADVPTYTEWLLGASNLTQGERNLKPLVGNPVTEAPFQEAEWAPIPAS